MGVVFTKDAAKRIADVVRRAESSGNDRGTSRLPDGPQEQSFWAFITGWGLGDDGQNLYSFIRVVPEHADPDIKINQQQGFRLLEPAVGYHHAAVEMNGHPVGTNVVVHMRFTGYRDFPGGERRPMFGFNFTRFYVQPFLPVHTHVDNSQGGFAFAVYHPGTGLPQAPWHL